MDWLALSITGNLGFSPSTKKKGRGQQGMIFEVYLSEKDVAQLGDFKDEGFEDLPEGNLMQSGYATVKGSNKLAELQYLLKVRECLGRLTC